MLKNYYFMSLISFTSNDFYKYMSSIKISFSSVIEMSRAPQIILLLSSLIISVFSGYFDVQGSIKINFIYG